MRSNNNVIHKKSKTNHKILRPLDSIQGGNAHDDGLILDESNNENIKIKTAITFVIGYFIVMKSLTLVYCIAAIKPNAYTQFFHCFYLDVENICHNNKPLNSICLPII